MNKELEIVQRLTAITKIGKLNMTLGLSEEMDTPCIFVLQNRELYTKLSEQIPVLQQLQEQGPFEVFLPEQKIIALLGHLGELLDTTILISVNEGLDVDCLVLFKDIDLMSNVYKEWKKIQEGFKWNAL